MNSSHIASLAEENYCYLPFFERLRNTVFALLQLANTDMFIPNKLVVITGENIMFIPYRRGCVLGK